MLFQCPVHGDRLAWIFWWF